MCKGKLAVLSLVAVSLLALHGIASAGIIDPCKSYCELLNAGPSGGTCCYFACPQGDTDTFIDSGPSPGPATGEGWYIRICVFEEDMTPVPDIPIADFWVVDCDPIDDMVLCAGSASSNADSLTNAQGYTTMSLTTLAAGGCVEGLAVVVQGFVLLDTMTCTMAICHDVEVRSCDINGDLCVDLVDLAIFATGFPPQPYDPCVDFECNGIVDLVDLARFAFHFGPPGHECLPPGCP